MAESSFSPYYVQKIIWVAELDDGTMLREWDENGRETLFKDIPLKRLKRFHLVSEDFNYWFDCDSGIFHVDGREFIFPLAGLGLNYGEGLIEFKEATTEFIPPALKTHPYDGFHLLGYQFGWKVTYGGMKSQVILNLPEKVFEVELTFLDIQKTVYWKLRLK
jgi:hypothetical protein